MSKITMPLLKELKSLTGEIVQHITREYHLPYAAPGNVGMQVTERKGEANRVKDAPLNSSEGNKNFRHQL